MKRIACLTLVLAAFPFNVFAQDPVPAELIPSITVTGSGEVRAAPDTARIQVGVVTEGETAAAALEQNTAAMKKLMATLKEHGLEDRDIQTTSFKVSPRYRQEPPYRKDPGIQQQIQQDSSQEQKSEEQAEPRIIGYEVTNQVMITVRKLSEIGTVLDAAVQSGANNVDSIEFDVAEKESLLDEARKAAVANARHKAEIYAKAENRHVRQALIIQEASTSVPRRSVPWSMGFEMAVPISAGEQTLGVSVTVTYHID